MKCSLHVGPEDKENFVRKRRCFDAKLSKPSEPSPEAKKHIAAKLKFV